jgi:hypothetical protein
VALGQEEKMTVRTNAVQTCDRCLKPFNEKHLKAGDEVPVFKQTGLVITKLTGTNKEPEPKSALVLSFDDMCPDCQNAVDNLIAKIRLDGSSKPKAAKKRGSKKKNKPASPPVQEYSEAAQAEIDQDKAIAAKAKAEADAEAAEEPGPGGEPAETTEPQESQEAAPETTEEPPSEETEENSEPEAEAAPEETAEAQESDGGNGAEAGSDDDNLMTDPATGDVYDKTTGEVVSKGNSGESEKHPF